jgi:hypothetical protein
MRIDWKTGLLTAAMAAGTAGAASAADLDHYYVPPERHVFVRPPPPPCGYDRPCVRPYGIDSYYGPYRRFGYVEGFRYGPYHEWRGPRPAFGNEMDRYGYDWPNRPMDRYGFDRPQIQPYERPGFHHLDHYGDDERRRSGEGFEPGLRPNYRYGADPYDRG